MEIKQYDLNLEFDVYSPSQNPIYPTKGIKTWWRDH